MNPYSLMILINISELITSSDCTLFMFTNKQYNIYTIQGKSNLYTKELHNITKIISKLIQQFIHCAYFSYLLFSR